ncbi:protein-tyrosine phosphatase [Clonorchis sinensis]|uniref:Protein-tyrosine phosphatase n=1 Tax=Clonorchis sinensis TaxID=79923 RepID=G7YWY2_CLOSI|nr:protein-tyrosine phosphatase [Clonorchis sinensis]
MKPGTGTDDLSATIAIFTAHRHWPPLTTHRDTLKGVLYQLDVAMMELGQPDNISSLRLPSGGMTVRHRKDATAEPVSWIKTNSTNASEADSQPYLPTVSNGFEGLRVFPSKRGLRSKFGKMPSKICEQLKNETLIVMRGKRFDVRRIRNCQPEETQLDISNVIHVFLQLNSFTEKNRNPGFIVTSRPFPICARKTWSPQTGYPKARGFDQQVIRHVVRVCSGDIRKRGHGLSRSLNNDVHNSLGTCCAETMFKSPKKPLSIQHVNDGLCCLDQHLKRTWNNIST